MKQILVLRGGALGDFLVTLPFLRALRHAWPTARIELVGNARGGGLAVLEGTIDAVYAQSDSQWSSLYAEQPLPEILRNELERFDLVVSFWPDPDHELSRHFPLRESQRFVTGSSQVSTRPAAGHFFRALPELAFQAEFLLRPLALPLAVQKESQQRLPPTSTPYIALHPGSGGAQKNWPIDRWCALTEKLLPTPLLVILGEADLALKSSFQRYASTPLRFAENWPLPLLAATLARCRYFIGHDTGVSHLAAAVGTPSLLLFGPTDPSIWAPPGPHVRVLKIGEQMATLTLEHVLAALPTS
ncbi:MAG TPA: glycosyltransferase family 9 protein [Opitutaceae bacterium]|nr:glycosyltransferase family 9 protein [Opitutaceae bacterium]